MWWKVYYSDGVFTSDDGTPYEAPRQDVQLIAQSHPAAGWEMIHGGDYFMWEPDRRGWWQGDIFTAMDHLIRAKKQCLLFGRIINDEEFARLLERVNAELGPRAGRTSIEPRREKT